MLDLDPEPPRPQDLETMKTRAALIFGPLKVEPRHA